MVKVMFFKGYTMHTFKNLALVSLSVCLVVGIAATLACHHKEESLPVSSTAGKSGYSQSYSEEWRKKEASHASGMYRDRVEKINRPDLRNQPSGPERIRRRKAELQIPEDKLKTLTTEDLLSQILDSPLRVHALIAVMPDGGLSMLKSDYNGVREFLKRPDASDILIKRYKYFNNNLGMTFKDPVKMGDFCFNFGIMETLMTSDEIVAQNNNQARRSEVFQAILSSIHARREYNKTVDVRFSGGFELYAAIGLARYLELLKVEKFMAWVRENKPILYYQKDKQTLFDIGVLYKEAKQIIKIAEEASISTTDAG